MISHGSQHVSAEMPYEDRSHQLGKGQSVNAAMSPVFRPSQLVYGRNTSRSQKCQAAIDTFHQLGEGHKSVSGMPRCARPPQLVSRRPINRYRNGTPTPPPEGRVNPTLQQCQNRHTLPTSFGPPQPRSNANLKTPNFNQRPHERRSNATIDPPRNQGDPIWTQDMKIRL